MQNGFKTLSQWVIIAFMVIAFFVSVGVFIQRTEAVEVTTQIGIETDAEHNERLRELEVTCAHIDASLDSIEANVLEIKSTINEIKDDIR